MANKSTNTNKTNIHIYQIHIKLLNTNKRSGQVLTEIQVLVWDRHKPVALLYWLKRSQPMDL